MKKTWKFTTTLKYTTSPKNALKWASLPKVRQPNQYTMTNKEAIFGNLKATLPIVTKSSIFLAKVPSVKSSNVLTTRMRKKLLSNW